MKIDFKPLNFLFMKLSIFGHALQFSAKGINGQLVVSLLALLSCNEESCRTNEIAKSFRIVQYYLYLEESSPHIGVVRKYV